MLAILKDAVECLEKYRKSRNSIGKELYENALEWVEDQNGDWLFSFRNVCDLLGFDPDYMKESLLKRECREGRPARNKAYYSAVASGK